MPSAAADFADRVVVISGGTQGLGEACARELAARGAVATVVLGRNAARGEAVAADIPGGVFHQVDLADAEAAAEVMVRVDEAFGAIHVLINAAATTIRGTVWDTSVETWDSVMGLNVRAPFQLIQGAVRIMRREAIEGSIVNVGSVAGHGGQPFLTPYATSKGALATLTRNVANALLPYRIRVNQLNLGWMDTPGEHEIQKRFHDADDDWLAAAEAGEPFGRLIKADEAARAVAFLASSESGLMTGALVDFDQIVIGTRE